MTKLRPSSSSLQKFLACLSTSLLLSSSIPTAFGIQDGGTSSAADSRPIAADLFQFPPTEPEDLLRAARITQRLDRIDDAKGFLRRFLELELPDADLRVVRNAIGTNELLLMRMDQRLSPEGEQVLKQLNAAASSKQITVEEMETAAARIAASGFDGTDARNELVSGADVSTSILLKLAPNTPDGRIAGGLIAEHIEVFQEPLLAFLQTEGLDAATQVRAMQLISRSADPFVADRILRFQFSEDPEVSAAARDAILSLNSDLAGMDNRETATEYLIGRSEQLLKDASNRFTSLRPSLAMRELKREDPRVTAVQTASALLAEALIISPENDTVKALLLVASISSRQIIDEALPAAQIIAALESAIRLDAAMAANELLRNIKGQSLNSSEVDSVNATLAKAIDSTDPRIRCTAAFVAMNEPAFMLSDFQIRRVYDSVRRGSEKPEAVVVTGEDRVLDDLKFAMEQAGFSVRPAQSGPDGFEAAAQQLNCELYLLSAEAPTWPLAVSIANLRADVRTRNVPIVVFGPERFRSRVEELAKIYPGVWFTHQPLATTVMFETRPSDSEFARVRTSRSEIRLNVGSLELPEFLLTPEDRLVMKAMAK